MFLCLIRPLGSSIHQLIWDFVRSSCIQSFLRPSLSRLLAISLTCWEETDQASCCTVVRQVLCNGNVRQASLCKMGKTASASFTFVFFSSSSVSLISYKDQRKKSCCHTLCPAGILADSTISLGVSHALLLSIGIDQVASPRGFALAVVPFVELGNCHQNSLISGSLCLDLTLHSERLCLPQDSTHHAQGTSRKL